MFDISRFAPAAQPPASERRTIGAITREILQLKNDAGNAILGIGQRLLEAKAMLPRGEWLPWLTERVEFSERQAQRFYETGPRSGQIRRRCRIWALPKPWRCWLCRQRNVRNFCQEITS
mgnify:CR=1 FL=1